MHTLVALDLETTGLDPELDAIIEIGAIRFHGQRVEGEWTSLVNPGRPLPPFITQLTGIDDSMLAGAPRLRDVAEELQQFVGEDPVLGHAVAFDLGFLRRRGLLTDNPGLDTYDLASMMLPDADRYSLASLAATLAIPVRTSHRALDDARATMQVYQRLFAQLLELPPELLQQLMAVAGEVDWGGGWILEDALDQLVESGVSLPKVELRPWAEFPAPAEPVPPLKPAPERRPLDPELLAAALEPGGAMAEAFPSYEHRSQQVTMLTAVATALSESQHLLVEAGTGTGKSMAYLIPAFAWAESNGERVLVSTNTLNLQDQLIYKDVPDLQRALGSDYRAAVLKGRGNYLCPRRFAALRRLGARTPEEARVLAKVLVWLHRGGSGDVSEITLRGPAEGAVWSRLASDAAECSLEACMLHTGGICPYYRARRAAESAHVLIVNHALLLADITIGGRVIPEYKYLIVDEAHHLESATTRGLSFQVSEHELLRLLREIGGAEGGLLGRMLRLVERQLSADEITVVKAAVAALGELAGESLERSPALFAALAGFLERKREGRPLGRYGQQERVVPSTRTLPEWSEVEIAWDALRGAMAQAAAGLLQLAENMQSLAEGGLEAAEDLAVALRTTSRGISEIVESLDETIFEGDPGRVYWLQLQGEPARLSIHAAPLAVGPLVERYLWHEKDSVIMTSATLTTAGEFDYMRRRLNADEADELLLGSPFDFETSTLLYLINDMPEPGEQRAYQRALESGLIALCAATGGRALVLFTSHAHLLSTSNAISPALAAHGVQVLSQSAGGSRHMLLESFKTAEGAVLLGTRSFWEGVDVPGPALSVLGIVRLPFDVPSDPIIAARAETFEDPFRQYSLPEAILRFRQGFGRLIRTRADRGVVVSFDRRLLSKQYGQAFLASLPACTRRVGPLASLPDEAARWLNL